MMLTGTSHYPPPQWSHHVLHSLPVPPSTPVSFQLVLRQPNLDDLKRQALAVSTPGHASYGHFLPQSAIDELTRPSAEDVGRVSSWLRGLDFQVAHEVVSVRTTAARAAALLQTASRRFNAHVAARSLIFALSHATSTSELWLQQTSHRTERLRTGCGRR